MSLARNSIAMNAIANREECMCPACIAAAALIAGSASTGGLTVLFMEKFGCKKTQIKKLRPTNVENTSSTPTESKENYDGNQQSRSAESESGVAG
jgi:hypothetical protein